MKIFFLIFLFLSCSLCAQDSTSIVKRNIIKPHIILSIWTKIFLQTNTLDLEFERGFNKRNSISAEVSYETDAINKYSILNFQYRHYLKNKKDKALRGFYFGAQLSFLNHQHKYDDFYRNVNYIGLTGLFGYQTFIKNHISLDWGLTPGIGFKLYDNYTGSNSNAKGYYLIEPMYRVYFSIGYSFFSR